MAYLYIRKKGRETLIMRVTEDLDLTSCLLEIGPL